MGRNRKTGLDYFPFDIDTFQDIKIRKLIKYQGGKAITIYALLLCFIYKDGYYMRWDKELPFIISEQTGFDEAYISEVIKSCLTLGLLSRELFEAEGVLTSRGIQSRYRDICKQMKRKCDFSEFSIIPSEDSEETDIPSEENGISSEEMPINSGKSTQNKKKGKENNKETSSDEEAKKARLSLEAREKELRDLESSLKAKEEELARREAALNAKPAKAPPKLDFVEEDFKEVFQTWLDYKKERQESYKSEKSLKICYNKLLSLSENNPEKATLIVEQSIANNWQGLFELKNTNHSKPKIATHDNNKQYTDF